MAEKQHANSQRRIPAAAVLPSEGQLLLLLCLHMHQAAHHNKNNSVHSQTTAKPHSPKFAASASTPLSGPVIAADTAGPGATSDTLTSGVASNRPGRVITVLSWLLPPVALPLPPHSKPLRKQNKHTAQTQLAAAGVCWQVVHQDARSELCH